MKTTKNELINKAVELGLTINEEMTKAAIMETINAATDANAINNGETLQDNELEIEESVTATDKEPTEIVIDAIMEMIVSNGEKISGLTEKLEELNANDKDKIKAIREKITSIRKDNRELAIFSRLVSLEAVDGTTAFFNTTADNLKLGQYRGLGSVSYYLTKITLAKPETAKATETIKATVEATRAIIDGLNLTLTSKVETETTIFNLIDTDIIPQRVSNGETDNYAAVNAIIKPWVERNSTIFSTDYKMLWFVSDTKELANSIIKTTANSNKRETYISTIENFIDKFQGIIQAKIKGLEAKRGKKAAVISV